MIISSEISDETEIRKLPVLGRGIHSTAYQNNEVCLLLNKNNTVPITSLNVMTGISSPNIIPLLNSYQTSSGKTVLVLPKGEPLMSRFSKADSAQKIAYIHQMMCGLYALHSAGFLHGDLKTANMLIIDNQVKLIDFDGSHRITDNKISHEILKTVWQLSASPYITAPELANYSLHHMPVAISLACDIWSLGISIFELYEGIMPQDLLAITTVKDMFARYEEIVKAVIATVTSIPIEVVNSLGIIASKNLFLERREKFTSSMPAGIAEIILSCLTFDPLQRPTISTLLQREIFRDFPAPICSCKPNNNFTIEEEIVPSIKLFPQEEHVLRCMAKFTSDEEALYILASKMTLQRPNKFTFYPPSINTARAIYAVLLQNNFWIY